MKNKRKADLVDVFYGNGEIDLPNPKGIAATWRFLKAQCGNTSPFASYPFGRISCGAYSGGYPTGYGNHKINYHGAVGKFDAKYKGISHIQQVGTGEIETYYNYALTSPLYGELREMNEEIKEEKAKPGYYACTFSKSGIKAETTVSEKTAIHRYHFDGEGMIQIDFSNVGLLSGAAGDKVYTEDAAEVKISDNLVLSKITDKGTDIYFAVECENAKEMYLWENYAEIDKTEFKADNLKNRFGCAFLVSDISDIKIGVSKKSFDLAIRAVNETKSFDEVVKETEELWESYLSRIDVKSENEEFLEIFYSNFYHSLIKPAKWEDEYTDFATMWDLYKTQLPLIFTLFKKEKAEITKTILKLMEENEVSPINVNLTKGNDMPTQARMLMEYSLFDSFIRGEDIGDKILELSYSDLQKSKDFVNPEKAERYTHILDISGACQAMYDIALKIGNSDMAEAFSKYLDSWKNAYDEKTGLLSTKSNYYEGDEWNYSFRLLKNMDERIAISGGKEEFLKQLDHFFGYTRESVTQIKDPDKESDFIPGVHSFEGFNNEPDMEVPYAYIYAGRHDKTCEVIRAGMNYMFTKGRGGLPGNNDSGGLSSCYVWNAIGLFPVSGQDLMLIGSPPADEVTLKLFNDKELKIIAHNNSDENIYVEKATLNGEILDDMMFSVEKMMCGGKLELFMKSK